jgi:hypothetical protein
VRQTGISPAAVSQIEKGRAAEFETRQKLIDFLDLKAAASAEESNDEACEQAGPRHQQMGTS